MKKIILIIVLVVASQPLVFAQNAAPSPTPPDENVVVINTNLIQIDVTVTNESGKIIKDLTADDFEVYENKQKQTITNFSFINLESGEQIKQSSKEKLAKNAVLPPPVPAKLRPEQVRRTIALVIDDLRLSFENVYFVKQSLKRFVDTQIQPGDLVAIIRTAGGIGALQQFTTDKRQLYAAIEKVKWNPAGGAEIGVFAPIQPTLKEQINGNRRIDGSIRDIQGVQEDREFENEIDQFREDAFTVGTLGAVNYVIKGMRELPGRKAVVLVSEGFRMLSNNSGGRLASLSANRTFGAAQVLVEQANRSGVVIYTVDPTGLIAPGFMAEDDTSGFSFAQLDDQYIDRAFKMRDKQQGLISLSKETGGFAVINQNSIGGGLRRVLRDQSGYYLIGYQPDEETFDPRKRRFNKLIVKVKREGLRVRYRSGFFGVKDEDIKPQFKTPQQQMAAALTSPFAVNEINLRLTSLFANDAQTGAFMRALIHVKGDDLQFMPGGDGWHKVVFDVVAMTFGDNGVIVDQLNRKETVKVRDEALKEIREKGFVYYVTMPVKKPGGYQMRVVIRDEVTSHLGSSSQFIEVPNLKKNRLFLSGLVLQRLEKDQAASDQKVKTLQTNEQRDAAERRFRLGANVIFGYAIYNAKLDKTGNLPRLTAQFKVFRDGKEVFADEEKPLDLKTLTNPEQILSSGFFRLGKNMPLGDYVLQVIVKDLLREGQRQIATQWIDFEITE